VTAETDLLPLPPLYIAPSVEPVDYPNVAQALMDYARDNVAHAVAPLQAEIEALRAEVAEWKRVAAAQAELHDEAEASAERLAEALRELVDLKDNVKHSFPNDYAVRKPLAWDKARAMLRDKEEGIGAFWGPSPKVGGPDWTGYGG
jgi:hypothetical protein